MERGQVLLGRETVAIGTLFKSGSKDLLERIRTKNFGSAEERTEAYAQLALSTDSKLTDVVQLLFTPDAELRRAVGAMSISWTNSLEIPDEIAAGQ